MDILYTPQFKRNLKNLPRDIQQKAYKRIDIFQANPKDQRLKTHKLKGNLKEYWSFSITYKYRIVFEFLEKDKALFHKAGDHDVYQ